MSHINCAVSLFRTFFLLIEMKMDELKPVWFWIVCGCNYKWMLESHPLALIENDSGLQWKTKRKFLFSFLPTIRVWILFDVHSLYCCDFSQWTSLFINFYKDCNNRKHLIKKDELAFLSLSLSIMDVNILVTLVFFVDFLTTEWEHCVFLTTLNNNKAKSSFWLSKTLGIQPRRSNSSSWTFYQIYRRALSFQCQSYRF